MIGELLLIGALCILAGLAWYPCGCATHPCYGCTAETETIAVTLSGFVDQDCSDCNETFNTTHIVTRFARCYWAAEGSYCSGTTYRLLVAVGYSSCRFWVALYPDWPATTGYSWEGDYLEPLPFDCTATMSAVSATGLGYQTKCLNSSGDPATIN